MLKLSLSLLLAAVCALFALGAVLDLLANSTTEPADEPPLAGILLSQFCQQANQVKPLQLNAKVQAMAAQSGLSLQLLRRQDIQLPASLETQLTAPAGLSLSAADRQLHYKALTGHPGWLLQLSLPQPEPVQPEDLWLTLALYLGLCLIMLLWLTPLARRLWLLSQTARAFGAGQWQQRLPASRWSYIPALEQSFNQMAQQIEQLLADNRLLASSLSHDLRTPIACLRFGLEAAQDAGQLAQKNHYLERMDTELDRMEAMVNAFLEFASLERQHPQQILQPTDLLEICQQALQACQPLASHADLRLMLHSEVTSAPLMAHPHWLNRALVNLLQNGCRYAASQVELRLSDAVEYWRLEICDDGAGIAKDDAERIFQPLVRLEPQSSQQPHFGLGLAIVRKVLEWQQGQITLVSFAPAGACFRLLLPKNPPG